MYLELGLVGILLLTATIISFYNNTKSIVIRNFEYGRVRMIIFCMVLTYNYTESSFTKPTSFLGFLFLLFGVRS